MEQCLIEGCPNEVKFVTKSGGRIYYSCEEHRGDVTQIVVAEYTGGERVPKWIKV